MAYEGAKRGEGKGNSVLGHQLLPQARLSFDVFHLNALSALYQEDRAEIHERLFLHKRKVLQFKRKWCS